MASQAEELRAMIMALAGSQALTLDALRRRGSIWQEDIDYILAVTEEAIAKALGTAWVASRGRDDEAILAAAFGFRPAPVTVT